MQNFTLNQDQRNQVVSKTKFYIQLANQNLHLQLTDIDIVFDLKGRTSGMFVVKHNKIYIRYNEIIFSQYFKDNLENTVAHEVAHYVVYSMRGLSRIKPHGIEWKQVMKLFNVKPEVTSKFETSELPLHRQNQHAYICGCMTHQLSTTRHNKVQNRKAVYKCNKCKQSLSWNCVT